MNTSRSERIKYPAYRIYIGKELRKYRIESGYTFENIKEMTGISIKSIRSMENGTLTNIDYYIVYAKAVKYPLVTLKQVGIEFGPLYKLSEESLKAVKLTNSIRIKILNTGFLKVERLASDIWDELLKLKLISEETTTTSDISRVMRNLIDDGLVKVSRIVKNKHYYISTD